MTKHCTICGNSFTPMTAQAEAKRDICYGPDCAKERQRRLDHSTMKRRRELRGKETGPRRTPCAACDMPVHVGETCREVAA